jgi:hypothetical protein
MKNLRQIASAVLVLAAASLVGCDQTHVEDPWVSGDQFADERERSNECAELLRQRLRTVQQDR